MAVLTWRTTHLSLEREPERAFGFIAERESDGRDRVRRIHKPVRREQHSPSNQVLHDGSPYLLLEA